MASLTLSFVDVYLSNLALVQMNKTKIKLIVDDP